MFHWVEVRAFCHATEDEDRVLAAMRAVLPAAEPEREDLEGHHGNRIVILTARTQKAAEIETVWRQIVNGLGATVLLADLDRRLDDGVFHVRLDKQRACLGEVALATSDDVLAIRGKVAAFPNRPEVARDVLRAYLEGL